MKNNVILVNDKKFNSIYISFNFLLPLSRQEASKNALLALLLKQGTSNYPTEKEIEKRLANLYSSEINISVDKFKQLYNIEVSGEFINKNFIDEDISLDVINMMEDIIYNPLIKDGMFYDQYFKCEKENLLSKLEEEKNDKRRYSLKRLEEEMFSDEEYGLNVLGNEEDIKKITNRQMYSHYLHVVKDASVIITIVGNLEGYENIEHIVKEKLIKNTNDIVYNEKRSYETAKELNSVVDEEKLSQCILAIGLKIKDSKASDLYVASLYNAILGETPSSKLFQNVREKESLAYFSRSQYIRHAKAIYIYSGVRYDKIEKAKEVIYKQIEDIKNGNFSDEELASSKVHLISSYKSIYDSKEYLAKRIVGDCIFFEKIMPLEDIVNNIQKIDRKSVIEFAKKIEIDTIYLMGGMPNE